MNRIVNPAAMKLWTATHTDCVACGGPGANAHHVLARGDGGDDLFENFVTLCGSGTMGCHGAYHGNDDVVRKGGILERHDRAWVAYRIGIHLQTQKPQALVYVTRKLGMTAGTHYLAARYLIEYEGLGDYIEQLALRGIGVARDEAARGSEAGDRDGQ